jgi:hypothetical protein
MIIGEFGRMLYNEVPSKMFEGGLGGRGIFESSQLLMIFLYIWDSIKEGEETMPLRWGDVS